MNLTEGYPKILLELLGENFEEIDQEKNIAVKQAACIQLKNLVST